MSVHHNVAIAGMGLAALTTAARLVELGGRDIAVCANGLGGTPYIAAINFVLPDNPYGDTPEQYAEDMIEAGYGIGNRELVAQMAAKTLDGYELLCRWGVEFARNADGKIMLRHVSGHRHPRSLCQTTKLIGEVIVDAMIPRLERAGVKFYKHSQVVGLLMTDGKLNGFTVLREGKPENIYAPVVVAAWGGVGNLLGKSTYPGDIRGNTLGMAKLAGAAMIDMEFLEFEPLVVLDPPGAFGEPTPTAMLGEGGILLDSDGKRFLLEARPQGEAGASKSLINREAWKRVAAGKGSPRGGVWIDLRHIDRNVLKSYPWFFNRLVDSGCDPNEKLIEIGPMAHSFSGGIRVDSNYQSNVQGLFAVGEACGGIHGACRSAGNAASQATLSGLLCAEGIVKVAEFGRVIAESTPVYRQSEAVREKYFPQLQQIAADSLGIYRKGETLAQAAEQVRQILKENELADDAFTLQSAVSVQLILQAAQNRKESRGTHNRLDWPDTREEYGKAFSI